MVGRSWIIKQIKESKGIVLFLLLIFAFRSSFADWSEVPTGSMQPTIVEGDRIFVNKMAYDIRVPFTKLMISKLGDPQRGDIIVFDSRVSDKRLVKRVIGVPGDIVELRNNVLLIDGEELSYQTLRQSSSSVDMVENLLGFEHLVRLRKTSSSHSSFEPVRIPEDMYLALGDNRDNSADSRVIGFVPRTEIVGRTRTVVMSLDYENYHKPRNERFFKTL